MLTVLLLLLLHESLADQGMNVCFVCSLVGIYIYLLFIYVSIYLSNIFAQS